MEAVTTALRLVGRGVLAYLQWEDSDSQAEAGAEAAAGHGCEEKQGLSCE